MGIGKWRGILLDPVPNPILPCRISPTITATLNYWKIVYTDRCLQSGLSHTSVPLSFLPLHIPHINIDPWVQRGVTLLEDLYDGSSLRSFEDLKEAYGLLDSDRFRYNQITHLIKHVTSKQRALPSPVLSLLSLPLNSTIKGSKVFYDLYTGNDLFTKSKNMVKWEEDLNKQFSPAQWQSAISWAHKSSSCANHKEQFHKLLSRWYFTPRRLAIAYPTVSPHCWRSCGATGSLLHIFWACPNLTPFWDSVKGLISQLLHIPCPQGPEFCLLLLSIESIPPVNRQLVCNILHAARLLIARRWKSADVPTILELTNMVSTICVYERTLAAYRGSSSLFLRGWDPWLRTFPNLC